MLSRRSTLFLLAVDLWGCWFVLGWLWDCWLVLRCEATVVGVDAWRNERRGLALVVCGVYSVLRSSVSEEAVLLRWGDGG